MDKANAFNVIQEITDLIGEEAANKLIEHYQGSSLDIASYREEVESLIGPENRRTLLKYFGRVVIYVPMRMAHGRKVRDKAIRRLFDEKSRLGMSSRKAVLQIAREFKLSDRYIWRILKKADE